MSTTQLNVDQLIKALSEIRTQHVIAAARSAIDKSTTEYMRRTRLDVNDQLRPTGQPIPARQLRARFKRTRTTQNRLVGSVNIGTLPFNPIRFAGIRDTGRHQRGRRGRVGRGVIARGGFQLEEAFIGRAPSGKPLVWTREGKTRLPIRVERIPIADEVNSAEQRIKPQIENIELPNTFHQELQKRLNKYG